METQQRTGSLTLIVNGREYRVETPPERPLLWVLREDLRLTGTKYGCGEGECGACTVLVEGEAVRSCRVRAGALGGKRITTIEALAPVGGLHPVQHAFLHQQAFQCGYCTPGMVMAAAGLLQKTPHPTEQQVREGLKGNVCRCGTYPRIVAAAMDAAKGGRS
ncbi:MAG: (2Fe-2S)-binding protein [Acidobacteria bacterium]|nr:(2Fe-2S)-binding protein [Acidobacteriota bacterium]